MSKPTFVEMVFDDGAGEDDESNEVTLAIGDKLNEHGQLWFQLENMDGECSCFLTKERWEAIKAFVDERFP